MSPTRLSTVLHSVNCCWSTIRQVYFQTVLITRRRSFAEYLKYFVARFNEVHAFGYNSARSQRIWMKFGELRVYRLELALTDFGRDPRRSESGRACGNFVFFGQVNNAPLCRFPVSQISRNLHTRRAFATRWILSEIFFDLPLRGLLQKPWSSSTISNFRPRFLWNDYKSWKVMTGWHAYGMLAFHLYRWNQLKVIRLARKLCTRKDFHGHWLLFRLVLQA